MIASLNLDDGRRELEFGIGNAKLVAGRRHLSFGNWGFGTGRIFFFFFDNWYWTDWVVNELKLRVDRIGSGQVEL